MTLVRQQCDPGLLQSVVDIPFENTFANRIPRMGIVLLRRRDPRQNQTTLANCRASSKLPRYRFTVMAKSSTSGHLGGLLGSAVKSRAATQAASASSSRFRRYKAGPAFGTHRRRDCGPARTQPTRLSLAVFNWFSESPDCTRKNRLGTKRARCFSVRPTCSSTAGRLAVQVYRELIVARVEGSCACSLSASATMVCRRSLPQQRPLPPATESSPCHRHLVEMSSTGVQKSISRRSRPSASASLDHRSSSGNCRMSSICPHSLAEPRVVTASSALDSPGSCRR